MTLIALAAACSLPAAAQAVELPPLQAADAAAQVQQTATAAAAPVLAGTSTVQGAVRQSADRVVAPAQPAVEQVAGTVTEAVKVQTAPVDVAARSVETAVAPAKPAAPVRPAAPSPGDRQGGVRALRSAPDAPGGQRSAPKRDDSAAGVGSDGRGPVTGPQPVTASKPTAGSATAIPASVDGGASATHDLPAGAGSTASASSTSFSIGAYALLTAALLLAGPAMARRLRVDRAWSRPTLFVSVLERPG